MAYVGCAVHIIMLIMEYVKWLILFVKLTTLMMAVAQVAIMDI
jgi:hypothetical protein